MTVTNLRVKVLRQPIIRAKFIPWLPASIVGRTGISVERDGLNYLLDLDYSKFFELNAFTPADKLIAVQGRDGIWNTTSIETLRHQIGADNPNLVAISGAATAADKLGWWSDTAQYSLTDFTSYMRSLLDDPDASTARATLGLVIGTDVQPHDAELDALAGLVSAADKLPYFTGPGAAALTVFTPFARTLLDDADAATARATLGLVIGTDVQAYDTDLDAIAALTPADNDFIQRKAGAWVNRSVAQVKTDLAISNVDNTSDLNKPISTATQSALDLKADKTTTLSAGTGLTGGGDLSASRSVALNSASIASLLLADTAVQPTRSITAGTGLTGGGDLSANRTIALDGASQGSLAKADTAVQPGDLATVATTGAYADLTGKPTLGTAAATNVTDYATAAQGGKADSALQSVVAGLNVFVDDTDPLNPVISATGGGGGGDVTGPSGATSGNIASFDGPTGKLVKDSGVNVSRLSNLTYRTPADFGAVGDGVSDDYSALVSCIQSGYPIDWGSQDKIYKIETEIDETVTHAISWRSSGATIKYDGAGAPRSTVTLKVYPLVHQIDGAITFDGNNKAHAGIYVTNAAGSITGSVYPSLTASRVRAINIYRSNISFGSSCGILVHGDFEQVNLLHPYVKDVHGAAAAQNPSIAGLSGITVTRGTTDYPRNIFILNPHVENVFLSDSQAYGDQDGIVIFGFVGESSGSVANSYDAKVIGGMVKNVRGRSLKGQIRNSYIAGLNVIKEASVIYTSGGLLSSMGDIELQNGECVVSGITMTLNGVSCEDMIRVIAPDNVLSPPSIVSDVRAIVNLVTPRSAIMFSQRKNGTKNWFSASNISIATGVVTYGVLIDDNSTSATGQTLCNLSGFVGRFGSAFVLASNASVASGYVNMTNIINAGATVSAYSGNAGWTVNKQNMISLS